MKCSLAKKGNKWYITYNQKLEDGNYKKVWITTGETSKTLASKKLKEIQKKIDNGIYVKKSSITLKELLDLWLDVYAETNLESSTINSYKIIIGKYILPYFKEIEVKKISALDIQKYYKYLQTECKSFKTKKGLSPNTVHKHHAVLRKVFNFGIKNELITRNVCNLVDLPKKRKYRSEVYNDEEVKLLLEKIENTEIEILVHLAVGLGLRLSEICGLTWENIDFRKSYVNIKQARVRDIKGTVTKDTKTDSSIRSIKIPKTLLDILTKEKERQIKSRSLAAKLLKDSDYVVANPDGSILHPSTLSHKFTNFLKYNNLKKVRLHDLRHTNITLLLKNKVDYKVVQRRGGWSSVKMMFDTYAHVLEEMEQDADEKIENAIYGKK